METEFVPVAKLSKGKTFEVFLVKNKSNDDLMLYRCRKNGLSERDQMELKRSITIMKAYFNDPCLVQMNNFYTNKKGHFIILSEFCSGGSLEEYINNSPKIPETMIIDWIAMTALGLKSLHDNGVLHRSVRTDNIFLEKCLCKLGELSFASIHHLGE